MRQQTPVRVVFISYREKQKEERPYQFLFQTLVSKRAKQKPKLSVNAFIVDLDDPNWAARLRERLNKHEAVRTDRLFKRIRDAQSLKSKSEEE